MQAIFIRHSSRFIRRRLSIARPAVFGARINPPVNSSRSRSRLFNDRSANRLRRATHAHPLYSFRRLWHFAPLACISRRRREERRRRGASFASPTRRRRAAFRDKLFGRQQPRVREGAALFSGRPPAQFRSLVRQERERERASPRWPPPMQLQSIFFASDFTREAHLADVSSRRRRKKSCRRSEESRV